MFNKFQYNSPVVLTFTLICFFSLILNHFTNNVSNYLFFSIYKDFDTPLVFLRLFTHVMGHASFEHFFNNFLIILLIGPMLEEKYSSKILLLMMLFTAFITGAFHILLFESLLLGASGIAFMMIILSSFANMQKGRIPITVIIVVIFFIGNEIISGLYNNDNISQISHIIGGSCGAVFGYLVEKYNLRKNSAI